MKSLFLLFGLALSSCLATHQVQTDQAPKAIGPYSQAMVTRGTVYCSGQIGIDPKTGLMIGPDISTQTTQALQNLSHVLNAAGSDWEHVTKVTIYLTDLDNFKKVNEIYSSFLGKNSPARSTVQVVKLPKDALIEIDCIGIQK